MSIEMIRPSLYPQDDFGGITEGRDMPETLWTEPTQFDPKSIADRREVERRFDDGRLVYKVDRLGEIANGLFEMYHPDKEKDAAARQEFIDTMTAEAPEKTNWFAFDWDRKLIRYPSEDEYFAARVFRNHDVDTMEESLRLRNSTHVIGGASVGSHIAKRLVQGGIGNTLILGDPDTVDLSNLNRLESDVEDLGQPKLDVLAKWISKKDPYIDLHLYREGFSLENLQEIDDEYNPDVYYDAVDKMEIKAAMRKIAHLGKAAVVMATDLGFKSVIDIERYDSEGKEPQPFNGRLNSETYQRLLAGEMSDLELKKVMTRIVGLRHVSARMIYSLMGIGTRLGGFPQLDSTAASGGALAAHAARGVLLDRGVKSGRFVHSPEAVLKTKSPTSRMEAMGIARQFLRNSRAA